MFFKKTARAALIAALIGGMSLGMAAISRASDGKVNAVEAKIIVATQETQIVLPQQTTESAQVIPGSSEAEKEFLNTGAYRGIEPDLTEDTLPDRCGFVYYPGVNLDKVTQDFIFVESGEAGVSYELVLAIIIHESNCDPNAISATSDYGLMQINKINHEWMAEEYGLTDMLDPRQNIIAGITILAQLYGKYMDGTEGGLHKVLMAYNMGPTGASKCWAAGTYQTKYSNEIMRIRDDLIRGEYTKGE